MRVTTRFRPARRIAVQAFTIRMFGLMALFRWRARVFKCSLRARVYRASLFLSFLRCRAKAVLLAWRLRGVAAPKREAAPAPERPVPDVAPQPAPVLAVPMQHESSIVDVPRQRRSRTSSRPEAARRPRVPVQRQVEAGLR
ncbi:hypothetical protein [Glycomyces algeriensis]|nr:hypothetical protein [Glycomyces algeriensis]MDA1368080.1 hypothetical protein [Glycomyces algeriensis]MDR7352592.1 hypothetical protein [Glycomyces algeriensis]